MHERPSASTSLIACGIMSGYQHVQAIIVAIDQYAEAALGKTRSFIG
jgi:hypothetical protein